jgi:hypothetical protein
MIEGTGPALVEQTAWNSKALWRVRGLEILTEDVGGVVEGGRKRLEAWMDSRYRLTSQKRQERRQERPGRPTRRAPRGDLGVDVPAELEKLRVENPAITLQGALRELYRRRPEIFVPVESPNEPLPIPETGVWQVPMIGSIHRGH